MFYQIFFFKICFLTKFSRLKPCQSYHLQCILKHRVMFHVFLFQLELGMFHFTVHDIRSILHFDMFSKYFTCISKCFAYVSICQSFHFASWCFTHVSECFGDQPRLMNGYYEVLQGDGRAINAHCHKGYSLQGVPVRRCSNVLQRFEGFSPKCFGK